MQTAHHLKRRMKSTRTLSFLIILFILFYFSSGVAGHGRLIEPPSRSSMWRFGFKTKPNYNDNELFCGGYTVQWQRNGGKCGVCGDPWDSPSPRPNEAGGVYGRGIIVRKYKPGDIITSVVDITANHMGFFEFKLCPHNKPSTVVKQDCLDRFPLELADGSGTKYYPTAGTGPFTVHLRLPDHLKCSQCVFQWTYTAGNNWGRCENGSSKVGCGPQETFRGCADVAIDDLESNDIPTFNERPLDKPSISAIPTRRTTTWPRTYKPRSTYKPRQRPSYRPKERPTYKPAERPSYKPSERPSYKPPARSTYKPQQRPSYNNRRPYYNNRQPSVTRKPTTRKPRPTRPTLYNNVASNKYSTRRPISRPTPYRPMYTPKVTPYRPHYSTKIPLTKKPRPTYKSKGIPKKTTNIESESGSGNAGGCKAVGVWASISGIASWCDSNCARGYCPSTHCDCS